MSWVQVGRRFFNTDRLISVEPVERFDPDTVEVGWLRIVKQNGEVSFAPPGECEDLVHRLKELSLRPIDPLPHGSLFPAEIHRPEPPGDVGDDSQSGR